MTTLIVTEKPNVAERIAKSIGNAVKNTRKGISYYVVDDVIVAPAVGHIYTLMEKDRGLWKYPVFDIKWVPSYKASKSSAYTRKYLDNLVYLAEGCDEFINACDYDLEGEVIGFNVLKHACKVDPLSSKVHRMKYSSLTSKSINEAYNKLDKINKGMVDAGLTRHVLDWYWGINLSRALTLAIRRARGYTTLSIGRVQGPALKFLAAQDRKISAFVPETYWELEMIMLKNKNKLSAYHEKGRFKVKDDAVISQKKCLNTAVVKKIKRSKIKKKPPYPFDLTTLQTEAYRVFKISPKDTLQIAQELYTSAYISYPRTSSQQLPTDINYRDIIEKLSKLKEHAELTKYLLSKKKLKPKNGRKKDPAHPAIHPTGELPANIGESKKKIFDLICRRFYATFGDYSIRENLSVVFDNNGECFLAKGKSTVEPGWQILYGKYTRFKEEELPKLVEGEVLDVGDVLLHEKETQPPKRYTPSSIIREMEKKNLGTKATRSQIIDILFKRGYLEGKSIEVTPLGLSVVDTLERYCPNVLSEKLTRKFESEMEQIESGKLDSESVIAEGREVIVEITDEFKKKESEIGFDLAKSFRSSGCVDSLGPCLKCDGSLVLRKSKYGGFFVGCSNYPQCSFKISIPKGGVRKSGECNKCGYAVLTLTSAKKPFSFCINPNCKG
ncbi:MAG: DNA topoisomerase I [Candidatus Altiarchaeales archaeon ex4484_96]|nr:MAG: DNA topoisomerase I [Candidatus Altiarchaeales archaeon ex4484_96]